MGKYIITDNTRKKNVFVYFMYENADRIIYEGCSAEQQKNWGHQFWFWLNVWQTGINSGRFTSSEIHECPASPSFLTTLGNVMHNIEFQPVYELWAGILSQTQHAQGACSQKLLTQTPFTKKHAGVQILFQ